MFTTALGGPIEPRNVNRMFHAICKKAGVPQVRVPLRVDGKALPMHVRPPRLGEHTDEILGQL